METAGADGSARTGARGRTGYRRSAGSPRGEARRRELLRRVTDDLAANGLVDFSLRRAAQAAGATHKVLLYYFDGADDLLAQAVAQLRERRIASGLAAVSGPAGSPQLAAAIAQTPNADGLAAARNAARHQTKGALLRLTGRGLLDALGGLAGREPLLVPLAGQPGAVAVVTTPDALDGDRALNPGNRYPGWQQAVAARSALRLGFYQPARAAPRIWCPLLVLVCDQDQTALAAPAVRAAGRAPRAELVRLPGGHYEPFLGGHEQAAEAELSFLRRHLLGLAGRDRPSASLAQPGLSDQPR